MSNYKTQIDMTDVQAFLSKKYKEVDSLIKLTGGESSQAYSFTCSDGKSILRVNKHSGHGFYKERFAREHFGSPDLPIPAILDIGEIKEGVFYAVSEQAKGTTFSQLARNKRERLTPELIAVLNKIHSLSPIKEGYGAWDEKGKAHHVSWRTSLLPRLEDNWQETKDAEFYDEDLHEKIRAKIHDLLQFCPEERQLIHGDYGFDNILSDGESITAIIDWEQSMYGDPLYDVAWLDRWGTGFNYGEVFKQHYQSQNKLPENYGERLECYKLFIALDALGFYAYSRQPDKYKFIKDSLSL